MAWMLVTLNSPPDMIIERDVAIPMDDGIVLRADVFRPRTEEKVPVIMTLGPYAKGLRYQDGYAQAWKWLITRHPEVLDGSTGSYLAWETVDPERWVPAGYAVIRVDSRGAGRSPGLLDPFSPREVRDFYIAIEWTGTQPWSNGKVGLCGISYYAINQWLVAGLNPPHLAAMIPWEGAADHYRDWSYHGGIFNNVFQEVWYPAQVLNVQHGKGKNGPVDPWLNEPAAGPETLTEAELIGNRAGFVCNIEKNPLDDEFHRSRSAKWSKVTVPFLSSASWAGFGLHPRGNFEGFVRAASKQKWLEAHGGRHEEAFYLPYAVEMQMRFFDYFLKGKKNGWDKEPPVMLHIRYVDHTELRKEKEWPLARTNWTKIYLDGKDKSLTWKVQTKPAKVRFEAMGDGVTFTSAPLEKTTEITGPLAAKLFVASSTRDADFFLTFLAFDPDGKELNFQGTVDPHTPLAQGLLRASHRTRDSRLSKPYRPYYTHDRILPLKPGRIYELDVELLPTCVVLPAGYRIALTIQGKDFQRPTAEGEFRGVPLRGSGPFLHNDPDDRPMSVFGGRTEIRTGRGMNSFFLLPVIPT